MITRSAHLIGNTPWVARHPILRGSVGKSLALLHGSKELGGEEFARGKEAAKGLCGSKLSLLTF